MPRAIKNKHHIYRCDFPGCGREVRGAFTGSDKQNHERLHFCSKHHASSREKKIIKQIRDAHRGQDSGMGAG